MAVNTTIDNIAGKYRPRTVDSLIGQTAIKKILKNKYKNNNIGHGMLFFGERGTGKTTTARIVASWLNCLNPTEDGPCLECEHCKAILNDACPDVIELDAAGNNKVTDMEQIIENVQYVPQMVSKKVVILDECHELSRAAFDKMLKIFEEPPEYVYFILCTTEINKVPAPIQSRMEKIPFKLVSIEDLVSNIKKVVKAENAEIEDSAAELIAKLAKGSVRDSMTLLQPLLGLSPITEDIVRETNALTSDEDNLSVVQGLLLGDPAVVGSVLSDMDIHKVPALLKSVIETISLVMFSQLSVSIAVIESYKDFITEMAMAVTEERVNGVFCALAELTDKNSFYVLGKMLEIARNTNETEKLINQLAKLEERLNTFENGFDEPLNLDSIAIQMENKGTNEPIIEKSSGGPVEDKTIKVENSIPLPIEDEECPFEVGEPLSLSMSEETISINLSKESKEPNMVQGPKMGLNEFEKKPEASEVKFDFLNSFFNKPSGNL